MKNYALYYCAGVEVKFNRKTNEPVRATWDYKVAAYNNFLYNMLMTGSFISLFGPSRYEPFHSEVDITDHSFSVLLMEIGFDWNLIRNNLICTILLQFYLTTFTSALVVIVVTIFGVQTNIPMRNPVFESTSPSDFWGRRLV